MSKEPTFVTQTRLKKLDTLSRLQESVLINPVDVDSWLELIQKTRAEKQSSEAIRSVYDRFLELFPRNGEVYLDYINFELSKKNNPKVEKLYGRSLTKCCNVELWRSYLSYVQQQHSSVTGGENAKQVVEQSFEFALKNIGMDMDLAPVWEDYIKFIDTWNPISSWEEQRKLEAKRRVYKQAVVVPMKHIEEMWAKYSAFENESGQPNGRKHIADLSPQYMLARTWHLEYTNMARVLSAFGENSADSDRLSLRAHKVWINLEKQNKLKLKVKQTLNRRIEFSYLKTLQRFPFYPDIWFEYAHFKLLENLDAPPEEQSTLSVVLPKTRPDNNAFSNYRSENIDKGIEILKEGLTYCQGSALLTYLLGQLYETKSKPELFSKVFDLLLDFLMDRHAQLVADTAYIQTELDKPLDLDLKNRIVILRKRKMEDEEEDDSKVKMKHTLDPEHFSDLDKDDDEIRKIRGILANPRLYITKGVQERYIKCAQSISMNKAKLERLITAVYINYIKMTKRVINKAAARDIFKNARKRFKELTWHIYYEEAMFEYNTASSPQAGSNTAIKILDRGMKDLDLSDTRNYPFLVEYFRFVVAGNDYTGIKLLFENCVKHLMPKEIDPQQFHLYNGTFQVALPEPESVVVLKKKALRELFEMLLRYELYNGNILLIQNIQHRFKETFFDEADFEIYGLMYKEYNGLNLLREFDVEVDARKLYTAWTDYDNDVEKTMYENLPSKDNLYKADLFASKLYKEINMKIKSEYLIDKYDSYGEFDELVDTQGGEFVLETSAEMDLVNYGLRSRRHAYRAARVAEIMNESDPKKVRKVDVDLAVNEAETVADPGYDPSKPFVSDDVYNLLRILPSADSFTKAPFNPGKVVEMFGKLGN